MNLSTKIRKLLKPLFDDGYALSAIVFYLNGYANELERKETHKEHAKRYQVADARKVCIESPKKGVEE